MNDPVSKNIQHSLGTVAPSDRETLLGQCGCVLWLTGLSGSGKSTIARLVEERLVGRGRLAYVLDGDNVRHGLNRDLGFAPEARQENIRRVGEVAALFADAGVLTICAFISPYRADRRSARRLVAADRFVEVHVAAPLEVCEARDPKGLYARARAGEIQQFTGLDAPYEAPETAELVLATHELTADQCADQVVAFMVKRGLLR